MNFKELTLGIALSGFASTSLAVTVTAQNKCDKPVPYKVESKGSTLNTQLGSRTSTSHNLSPGDRIRVGNNVMFTASASSGGQTVIICNK